MPLAPAHHAAAQDPDEPEAGPADPGDDEPETPAAPAHAVIIHIDGGRVMAGFAGDKAPKVEFPAVVGRPREGGEPQFGDAALSDDLQQSWPVELGRIVNVADYSLLIGHALDGLHATGAGQALLLTVASHTPFDQLEQVAKSMFETHQVGSLFFTRDAVTALYASGRTTGLVVVGSYDHTGATAIYDGHTIQTDMLEVGERQQVEYLAFLLKKRGIPLDSNLRLSRNPATDIYRKLAFVADDFDAAEAMAAEGSHFDQTCALPGGQQITVGAERYHCAETLFRPTMLGRVLEGIHFLAYGRAMRCDADLRPTLYANVVLAGNVVTGTAERLTRELTVLVPQAMPVKVAVLPHAQYGVFEGASLLAGIDTYRQMWISRADYDASGPAIVKQKCQ
ncbi:MAG: hypothetical protein AB7K09_00100 [Planctomycetota bacterium]